MGLFGKAGVMIAMLIFIIFSWEGLKNKWENYRELESQNKQLIVDLEHQKQIAVEKEERIAQVRASEESLKSRVSAEIRQADMREKRLERIENENEDLASLLDQCRISTDSLRR